MLIYYNVVEESYVYKILKVIIIVIIIIVGCVLILRVMIWIYKTNPAILFKNTNKNIFRLIQYFVIWNKMMKNNDNILFHEETSEVCCKQRFVLSFQASAQVNIQCDDFI